MAKSVSHQPETPISARYLSSVDMVHVCDRDFDIYCCFYYIFEFRKLIYIFRLKKLISILSLSPKRVFSTFKLL